MAAWVSPRKDFAWIGASKHVIMLLCFEGPWLRERGFKMASSLQYRMKTPFLNLEYYQYFITLFGLHSRRIISKPIVKNIGLFAINLWLKNQWSLITPYEIKLKTFICKLCCMLTHMYSLSCCILFALEVALYCRCSTYSKDALSV